MPLLDRTGEIADRWVRIEGDAALPTDGDIMLPLARLDTDGAAIRSTGRRLGVAVPGDTPLDALVTWLDRSSLIAISFPGFTDGRGFSLARQLRRRGFAAELRASGALIADQFGFALACGFDTVEISASLAARQPIADWLAAAEAISLSYQRDYGGPRSILDARRAARGARIATVAHTEPAK